jgi:precorrin-2 dehydrogenase/sirohydrochlorin ferrochelatase
MPYYPIFLDLKDKPVLVVGAGKVALRKTRGLVEAGALVTVVAPQRLPDFAKLPVKWLRRRFRSTDLKGMWLAFTATDDRKVNAAVARAAKRHGIPINVADAPAECDFFVPARVRSGDLQIAVSTSGRSPRLAAELRRKIEETLLAANERI